jgi:ureidoglycolate hydrolase
MGKSVNPNKLYKKMGGKSTAFNPVKIQKSYSVTVNKVDLTGTAKQKQKQLRELLANRTQGVIIRKNNKQVAVAYLDKKGNIKINDPSIKDGSNLDISKTSFKKYSNIDFVTTIDKK